MGKLPRRFYERPTVEVSRELLAKVFVRRQADALLKVRIVEVEAYTGQTDPGSHAFRGRTRRTEVMFGPPGHLYVYFTYGMHYCMNVVTEREGIAGAVLIRAGEPLEGINAMARARGAAGSTGLCNGPAKLCQALGITREHNGADLEGPEIWIEDDGHAPDRIAVSTRVGLSAGRELPLRFYLPDNPYVSPGRPSGSGATLGDDAGSRGRSDHQELPITDSHCGSRHRR